MQQKIMNIRYGGNLRTWFEANKITHGTRIFIKFDPQEKINGNCVVGLLIEKNIEGEIN